MRRELQEELDTKTAAKKQGKEREEEGQEGQDRCANDR